MGSHWSYFIDTAKLQGGETLQIENYPKIKNKLPKAADLLRDLPKLKHIVVRYCKLTTLPTDLNLLSSLTHLDLEGHKFENVNNTTKSMRKFSCYSQ
jgi:Leucine-rich repeat (LRR) protein